MQTERQKMLAGELLPESHREDRRRLLRHLFGAGGDTVWMQPPFFCDYGANIELGERVLQLQLRCPGRLPRSHWQLLHVWSRGADLHTDAPA